MMNVKGGVPDYSMDFSKIREMRKQNKRDPSRASLGNEEEFVNKPQNNQVHQQPHHHHHLHHEDHHEMFSPSPFVSVIHGYNSCILC
ncbi:hypothetical protein ACHQM5_012930 [Ranunculus cassubicifolius]